MATPHDYIIIMAGGTGTRFWPLSRRAMPKQFIDILQTGHTLFQQTVDRARRIVPDDHIWVVTNQEYVDMARQQAPHLPPNHILGEPVVRNTAPAIAYGVWSVHVRDPHARIAVMPADHYIQPTERFRDDIQAAMDMADQYEGIITLGIVPTYPATGYGYIQIDTGEPLGRFRRAVSFLEKPNIELARQFFDNRDEFYWNAGIFVASSRILIEAYRLYLPTIYQQFARLVPRLIQRTEAEVLEDVYAMLPSISIDYGIMEKCTHVLCLPASFQWSDVGAWRAVHQLLDKDLDGNVVLGKGVHLRKTHNSLVYTHGNGQLVVLNEIDGVVVIHTPDVLLVTPLDKDQEVRSLVNEITAYYGGKYV